MTRQQATAEVFLTALKGLPKKERDAVVAKIAMDKTFARDILDLATIRARNKEPARRFRNTIKSKKRKLADSVP